MKKKDLAKLAILGISAGLVVTGCQKHQEPNRSNNKTSAAEQLSPDMQAFFSSLSPQSQNKFMQLDAQHKMMSMEMAAQGCHGKNGCSGMGGCETRGHMCAGENDCKGQGGAPVRDFNKAVDVQYKNQEAQRQRMNGNKNGNNPAPYQNQGNRK